jgi:hypothetical protein
MYQEYQIRLKMESENGVIPAELSGILQRMFRYILCGEEIPSPMQAFIDDNIMGVSLAINGESFCPYHRPLNTETHLT